LAMDFSLSRILFQFENLIQINPPNNGLWHQ
jgi:hypothetical protein